MQSLFLSHRHESSEIMQAVFDDCGYLATSMMMSDVGKRLCWWQPCDVGDRFLLSKITNVMILSELRPFLSAITAFKWFNIVKSTCQRYHQDYHFSLATIRLATTLCRWLDHGDSFKILAINLTNLSNICYKHIQSVNNISQLSPVFTVSNSCHQHWSHLTKR